MWPISAARASGVLCRRSGADGRHRRGGCGTVLPMQAALDADRLQRELEAIFCPRRVSLRPVDLETYARDMWPRMLLGHREGHKPAPPHAVVWPEHVREIVQVIKLARELRMPIVPYGGGSGVCGG